MKIIRMTAAAFLVGLLGTQAQAQVCGDGLVTGGEACDVAATPSGDDECSDGCADDCTRTQECGVTLCEDGVDNDGDGLVDSDDPECTTLLQLQPIAVAGLSDSPWGVKMGMKAEVQSCDSAGNCGLASGRTLDTVEPYPFGDSKADVCTTSIQMQYAILEGSLVATDVARFFGPEGYTGVASEFVTDTGTLPDMRGEFPKIGPPIGLCLDGVTPCLVDEHCPPPIGCENRLDLQDPLNTAVDLFGTGTGSVPLADCTTVQDALDDIANEVGSLGGSGADLKVKTNATATVGPLSAGPNILNYGRVRLGRHAKLTINGPADASLVAVLSRGMRLGREATIELTGGILPRNVLFALAGDRGTLSVGREAQATGTMLAPGRSLAVFGWESILNGSVFARSVRLKERSRIRHTPFTGLLPTDLSVLGNDTPDPVTAGNQLTYNLTVSNNGFAWAPAATFTQALDTDVSFVSATTSQGTCVHDGSANGGEVHCFLGALADQGSAPANQATIAVTVRVHCDARGNVSTSTSVTAQTADLSLSNNSWTITTNVLEDAAFVLTSVDSVDPVEEGNPLSYTITVQNSGASSCARTVNIADTLPAALVGETVSIAPATVPGCDAHLTCTAACTAGAFPCSVTNLPPGQTVTIQVTGGTVADGTGVLGSSTELSNTVNATSPDASGSDTETTNVLRNQGDSCSGGTGADCVTSSCVDGFCCGGTCGGTCEACNLAGSEGTCTGIPANTDPVNECGSLCSVCDGNGGSGAGACIPATNGTDPNSECATANQNTCGFDGQCDGAGACRFWAAGTACQDQSDTACTNPDTCNGSGTCLPNHEPVTTLCTGASQGGVCDDDPLDHCSGSSAACVDVYKASSVVCRADAGQCDVAETCTGSSGACPADAFEPVTTACTGSSQGGVCDNDAADRCSGSANSCNDAFQAASFVCRADSGQCDVAETCTGSSGACPADAFEPNTTPCTGSSQGGLCDDDPNDACSGIDATCTDAFLASGVGTCP